MDTTFKKSWPILYIKLLHQKKVETSWTDSIVGQSHKKLPLKLAHNKGSRNKVCFSGPATKAPLPPSPSSSVATFFEIFSELQKKFFFLVARHLPLPLFEAGPQKKRFFCVFPKARYNTILYITQLLRQPALQNIYQSSNILPKIMPFHHSLASLALRLALHVYLLPTQYLVPNSRWRKILYKKNIFFVDDKHSFPVFCLGLLFSRFFMYLIIVRAFFHLLYTYFFIYHLWI